MLPIILATGADQNPIVPFLAPSVSVVAAIVAVIAARFAWLQKQTEMWRALRSQMSDAVSKTYLAEKELLDIEAELDLMQSGEAEKKRKYLRSKRIVSEDQCYLIAHQAAYLLQESLGGKKIHLISKAQREKLPKRFHFGHMEYAAIARSFGMRRDPQARDYWKLVLEESSDLPQALYRREFSKFLFSTNAFPEGRDEFRRTLEALVGKSDNYLWQRIWTYFEWTRQEKKKACDREKAYRCFKEAVEIIKQLGNEEMKNTAREIIKRTVDFHFPWRGSASRVLAILAPPVSHRSWVSGGRITGIRVCISATNSLGWPVPKARTLKASRASRVSQAFPSSHPSHSVCIAVNHPDDLLGMAHPAIKRVLE